MTSPAKSTLFPYTTLFRSAERILSSQLYPMGWPRFPAHNCDHGEFTGHRREISHSRSAVDRSEEHTSELQSLTNLVCRLLLEKKKSIPQALTPRSRL